MIDDSMIGPGHCTCVFCPVHQYAPSASPTEAVYTAVLDGRLRVDSEGRIWRRTPSGEIRAETPCQNEKYLRVKVRVHNRLRNSRAHRLVWRHFHGLIPDGCEVNHVNGDGWDNRPSNLEVVTPRENSLHTQHVLKRGRLTPMARALGSTRQDPAHAREIAVAAVT